MISVCIPVYNFNISELVNVIKDQITDFDFELIVIDDASDENFKSDNKKILDFCKYIELDKNIGRSKIRNLFKSYV